MRAILDQYAARAQSRKHPIGGFGAAVDAKQDEIGRRVEGGQRRQPSQRGQQPLAFAAQRSRLLELFGQLQGNSP